MLLTVVLATTGYVRGQGNDAGADDVPSAPRFMDWRYLRDPGGTLSLESVQSMTAGHFTRVSPGLLSVGYTRDAIWIRFAVLAPAGHWYLDILPPYLDDIRLYRIEHDQVGLPVELHAGDHLPYGQRAIPYRGFAFKMSATGDTPENFLLRVQTTSAYHLVARVWPESLFPSQTALESALGFAALAILLTFLILNLNHFLWVKDSLQAWLCAYLVSLIVVYTAVLGFSAQFVIPDHPEWNDLWMGLGNMALMMTSSGFHRRLFGITSKRPVVHHLYRIGCWLPLLGIVGVVTRHYPEIMTIFFIFYLLLTLVGLGLSLGLLRRKEPGGLLTFLAAFSGLTGTLIVILNLEGVLLGGLIVLYSMMTCSIIQVGLLHLTVATRYQHLEVERIREAEKANRAKEEAHRERAARVEQSDLFAMISHEIRTPLTMINGAVQSLEALVDSSPDIDRRHERIRKAVWRIDSLVEKALEYDLSETQMSDAGDMAGLDVGLLAARVIRQYDLPEGRIRLRVEPGPCRVKGQVRLIEILLGNLIDNALKYGGEAPVDTHVALVEHDVTIDVRDWGPGVMSELRPHLFERYWRGSHHGNITGAGLGLFLVARIARWHGGDVRYLQPEGAGACFRVRLPAANPIDPCRRGNPVHA